MANCLDKIEEKKDLVSSARCLVAARKRFQLYELKLSPDQHPSAQLTFKKPSFIQWEPRKMRTFDLHGNSAKRIAFKSSNFMKPRKMKEKLKKSSYSVKYDFQNSRRFSKFSKKTYSAFYPSYSKRTKRFTFNDLIKSQINNRSEFRKNSNNWKVGPLY